VRLDLPWRVTGSATTVSEGRAWAAVSAVSTPVTVCSLDDPAALLRTVPETVGDVVLAVSASYIVTAGSGGGREGLRVVRAWRVTGERAGPDIWDEAEITAAAVRVWPAVYIARADRTVSLTDVETGRELCGRLLLPARPSALAVAPDGDLVVGFGADVACVSPPVGAVAAEATKV
jgi:hypothetical protein